MEEGGEELQRLEESASRTVNWQRWGPYLSERQWGTVREDYSADGDVWRYFTHDQARSRAYRWGEDGLLGITDRECRLCFALALWNGKDSILKERLFGLSGPQGNHGEDVKECYFYLDSTPTHSYMKALYKYPQEKFPYELLVSENARRGKLEPEFELVDTGIFDADKYFDVFAEYSKAAANDILVRITVANRSSEPAPLDLLATLWYRNTWSWGAPHEGLRSRPRIRALNERTLEAVHPSLGTFQLLAGAGPDGEPPEFFFTENETNPEVFGLRKDSPYVKDAFHDAVIHGRRHSSNPSLEGSKTAVRYHLVVGGKSEISLRLRLADTKLDETKLQHEFEETFRIRRQEAENFYAQIIPEELSLEERRVVRLSFAGLLWSKQFYHYIVHDWLTGDLKQPPPPGERYQGRNVGWQHVYNYDVLSMPDKWEYPWYAAWDLAFHMIAFARIDPVFAKQQLVLMLREWYMHPNGALPAYEFGFNEVNPPVHAWACWRLYKMTGERGERDRLFLSRCFQKLVIDFTWWVNRKDREGRNLFSGGFLGLDNVGVVDRSKPLPGGMYLEQADGTAWMAFFCATMLSIALELSRDNPATEDMASKFFEHFVAITDAINTHGGGGLWDEEDGFYYDRLKSDSQIMTFKVRSLVGLIPLIAVEPLDEDLIRRLPGFRKRLEWFLDHRPDLCETMTYCPLRAIGGQTHRLLALPSRDRLVRMLRYLLDENEFLSPYGVRSLSRFHKDHPYTFNLRDQTHRVDYEPAESTSGLFGGNSNWRGPIWFPINYLLIEALERYHYFYGDRLKVECPTGSGILMNLKEVADELAQRLVSIFAPRGDKQCPWQGNDPRFRSDPNWRDLVLFHEYFHGETGKGLGASHQTGWTALAGRLITELGLRRALKIARRPSS